MFYEPLIPLAVVAITGLVVYHQRRVAEQQWRSCAAALRIPYPDKPRWRGRVLEGAVGPFRVVVTQISSPPSLRMDGPVATRVRLETP
jgi:hypothetical protein